MGHFGMLSFAGFMILMSLSMLVLLSQHIAAFDWRTTTYSSSSSLSAGSKSYDMEDLLQGNMVMGEEMRRRRLQQAATPAPAPAPAAAGDGEYIGYGVLTAGYVPCPPQSGRSYYTAGCDSATGPVNPYTRGCSSITLCSRS